MKRRSFTERYAETERRAPWSTEFKRPDWLQAADHLERSGHWEAAAELHRMSGDLLALSKRGRPEWVDRDTPEWRELRAAARRRLLQEATIDAELTLRAELTEAELCACLGLLGVPHPTRTLDLLLIEVAYDSWPLPRDAAFRLACALRLRSIVLAFIERHRDRLSRGQSST